MSLGLIGTGIALAIDLALAGCSLVGMDPSQCVIPGLLQSSSGLACTLTWPLTFAPPKSHPDWVQLAGQLE